MPNHSILTLTLAVALAVATRNAPAANEIAGGYDDARVTAFSISTDGDNGKIKATCKYGYANTGTLAGYKVPWTSVQFYLRTNAGGAPEVFHTQKSCAGSSCVAETVAPAIPSPGRIAGCRLVSLQAGAELLDAIKTNNFKEAYFAAPARTGTTGAAGSSVMVAAQLAGPAAGVKQCRTSLAATVAPQAQQFAGPLNGPADFAPAKLTLYLASSQPAGNSFVCRYASHGKDVADFAVSVQCPNAAPRSGSAHAFTCSG